MTWKLSLRAIETAGESHLRFRWPWFGLTFSSPLGLNAAPRVSARRDPSPERLHFVLLLTHSSLIYPKSMHRRLILLQMSVLKFVLENLKQVREKKHTSTVKYKTSQTVIKDQRSCNKTSMFQIGQDLNDSKSPSLYNEWVGDTPVSVHMSLHRGLPWPPI